MDTLADQTEKLKRFVISKGLGEVFMEFVKLLAPKTMKQELEKAKTDASEYNQQRKNNQRAVTRGSKQWK